MTKKQQKTKKVTTDQKVDQVLGIVKKSAKRQEELAENQELILKTMNEFSSRIEEKIDNIDIKVDKVEDSLKKGMKGMENRMVNKDYLDRKFAAAGIKTSTIPV